MNTRDGRKKEVEGNEWKETTSATEGEAEIKGRE